MTVSIGNNLFFDMATMLEAGVPPLRAASTLSVKATQRSNWDKVIRDIESGRPLSQALFKAQMIDAFEREMLAVAENAGRLETGLKKLAHSQDERAKNRARVKSKLFYPFAVYMTATVVSTILFHLHNPNASTLAVAAHLLLPLALGYLAVRWLLKQFNKSSADWLISSWRWRNQQWYQRLFQQTIFDALLWQIQSGVDMQAALKKIASLLPHKRIRMALNQLAIQCGKGFTLSQALGQSQLPIRYDLVGVIHTAEQSGTMASSLEHYLKRNAEDLQIDVDQLVEWLPRIFYALTVFVAIWAILP